MSRPPDRSATPRAPADLSDELGRWEAETARHSSRSTRSGANRS